MKVFGNLWKILCIYAYDDICRWITVLAFLTIQRIALNMQPISINQSINELLTFVFTLLRRRQVGVIVKVNLLEGRPGKSGGVRSNQTSEFLIADHWWINRNIWTLKTWSNFRFSNIWTLKFLVSDRYCRRWARWRRGSRWSSSTSSKIGGWGKRGERGIITPSLVNSQRSGRRGN